MQNDYKIIDGKKYVLAEDENVDSGPEPEIFQQLTPPPRSVALPVRLLLWFNYGTMPLFGWIFTCFGMIFCIIFLPWTISSIPDLTHRNFEPAGKGKVVDVVETSMKVNNAKVFRYDFEQPDGKQAHCFASRARIDVGDKVDLEKSGTVYRIKGTSLSMTGPFGVFTVFVVFFPCVGMGFVLYGVFHGRKAIALLEDGEIGRGGFIDETPTNMHVNGRSVMKLHFKFETSDGGVYDAYTTALDTSTLKDGSLKPLFYDPMDPTRSVLLDGLPTGIRFDEFEQTFKTSIFRTVLPVFFCSLFLVEAVALAYSISIGGFLPIS